MNIHSEALSAIRALREWIKAVPADVAAALPAMPGVEADWLDMVEGELVMFVELEGAHADAHARFRTLMGIPFDESRATQSGDSEEVRKKLPLPYPQGEPGMGGVLLHGTVLVPVEGQDQPQPRAVARMACPMCHGDSGYHRAVPVDGTLPTGNPNIPMTAQYVACARCDGADGVPLDGAHWHREPVFPIGYEAQPANGQRIAGLNDQRQNEPQIIPKTISAPLADHIAALGKMVALDGDLARERALFEEAMYRRVAHLMPNRAVYERSCMHKDENGDYINPADMVAWDMWVVARWMPKTQQGVEDRGDSVWRAQVACWCETCDKATNAGLRSRMSLCPQCGDKRCKRAQHHDNDCSNDKGAL